MKKRLHLGEFEELVLLSVAALAGDAYGNAVQDQLKTEAGRRVTLATVHSALYRLEKKGYLKSRLGGASTERGGRSKRFFDVTASGRTTLQDVRKIRDRMWNLVPEIQTT